jgi:putative FmdB family regulatory protein
VPTYEYACSACDTKHEVQQKMTDPTLTVCPSCGESTLRKLFSGVGIHFKGSGFYRTDSRDSKTTSSSTSKESSGSTSTSTPAAAPSTSSTSSGSSGSSSTSSSSTPAAST